MEIEGLSRDQSPVKKTTSKFSLNVFCNSSFNIAHIKKGRELSIFFAKYFDLQENGSKRNRKSQHAMKKLCLNNACKPAELKIILAFSSYSI